MTRLDALRMWIVRLVCPHLRMFPERDTSGKWWMRCETCDRLL